MTEDARSPAERHRVVIVGGGFGGLKAARKLARKDVSVTLVDRVNHHLFQPLLYQVSTGILAGSQIAPALRDVFVGAQNVRVILAEVREIDLQRRTVTAAAASELILPYDTLIVAAGARDWYFGHDEWERDAPGMKSLDDAFRIRTRILNAFEQAETSHGAGERDAYLTFVIVGAGPTGVELAGQLAYLSRHTLKNHYRAIRSEDARIVLLDAESNVLPSFPGRLRAKTAAQLRRVGVEVLVGTRAISIGERGIDLSGPDGDARIASNTVLWAAGVRGSVLAEQLARASGATLDRLGRLAVAGDLSLPGHPEVFAIGDMIAIDGVPGVAQAALQEGAYVAQVVAHRLSGRPAPAAFRYRDKGNLAIVGRSWAVADIRGVQLTGFLAWLIWAGVHIAFLVDWQKRLEVIRRWFWEFLTQQRHERLISAVSLLPDDLARSELESAQLRRSRENA